jgi:hypothetical protein
MTNRKLSRRDALKAGALGAVGVASSTVAATLGSPIRALGQDVQGSIHGSHHEMVTVGQQPLPAVPYRH